MSIFNTNTSFNSTRSIHETTKIAALPVFVLGGATVKATELIAVALGVSAASVLHTYNSATPAEQRAVRKVIANAIPSLVTGGEKAWQRFSQQLIGALPALSPKPLAVTASSPQPVARAPVAPSSPPIFDVPYQSTLITPDAAPFRAIGNAALNEANQAKNEFYKLHESANNLQSQLLAKMNRFYWSLTKGKSGRAEVQASLISLKTLRNQFEELIKKSNAPTVALKKSARDLSSISFKAPGLSGFSNYALNVTDWASDRVKIRDEWKYISSLYGHFINTADKFLSNSLGASLPFPAVGYDKGAKDAYQAALKAVTLGQKPSQPLPAITEVSPEQLGQNRTGQGNAFPTDSLKKPSSTAHQGSKVQPSSSVLTNPTHESVTARRHTGHVGAKPDLEKPVFSFDRVVETEFRRVTKDRHAAIAGSMNIVDSNGKHIVSGINYSPVSLNTGINIPDAPVHDVTHGLGLMLDDQKILEKSRSRINEMTENANNGVYSAVYANLPNGIFLRNNIARVLNISNDSPDIDKVVKKIERSLETTQGVLFNRISDINADDAMYNLFYSIETDGLDGYVVTNPKNGKSLTTREAIEISRNFNLVETFQEIHDRLGRPGNMSLLKFKYDATGRTILIYNAVKKEIDHLMKTDPTFSKDVQTYIYRNYYNLELLTKGAIQSFKAKLPPETAKKVLQAHLKALEAVRKSLTQEIGRSNPHLDVWIKRLSDLYKQGIAK